MNRVLISFFCITLFVACRPEVYTPKPRGYFKVDLPEKGYAKFDSSSFPYRFEYPVYSNIIYNPKFFEQDADNPFWLNIDFPDIGGKIYLSYTQLTPENNLQTINEDMYRMTFNAHDKKADYIENYFFSDPSRDVYGIFYNVTGDAASAYQFYATDSANHFLRGALYFNVAPNADSLKPLNEFLKEDIDHMLKTLHWNN